MQNGQRKDIMCLISYIFLFIANSLNQYIHFIKMNDLHPLENYQNILKQSTFLQNLASSLTSSLNTCLILLPRSLNPQPILSKEMQEIKHKLQLITVTVQQNIRRQAARLAEVNECVTKISYQFKQLIDLVKYQTERSDFILAQLKNQLRCKVKEIKDGQFANQKMMCKMEEQEWKQEHYITARTNKMDQRQSNYLELLKDIKNKMEIQIRFQTKQMTAFKAKINNKLLQFRTRLLQKWNSFNDQSWEIVSPHKLIQTNPENLYNKIEKAYVKKQTIIDQFEMSKFQGIKKKLRLLQQADMSESRQQRSCSLIDSKQDNFQEGAIMEIPQP